MLREIKPVGMMTYLLQRQHPKKDKPAALRINIYPTPGGGAGLSPTPPSNILENLCSEHPKPNLGGGESPRLDGSAAGARLGGGSARRRGVGSAAGARLGGGLVMYWQQKDKTKRPRRK